MRTLRVLGEYNLSDIPEVDVPEEVIEYARKISPLLDKENRGQKTMDGGDFKNIKGTIGQWAVHRYLEKNKWEHTYSKPYVEKQYGDKYDIVFTGDVWEVKCRDWWNKEYYYNIKLLMGKHEKAAFQEKKCDKYIFTTVSKDYSKAYILGGIGGNTLWNELQDLTEEDMKHTKYPTEGKIISRQLIPILRVILNT